MTGHRAARLPPGAPATLPATLEAVFRALGTAVTPARAVLHTPLATGADQIAADAARAAGFRVHALLPFAAADYAADFAAGAEQSAFAAQCEAADSIVALAGDRAARPDAYVAVGRAVIAASDVIVAVWDGKREIVPGGTAHVVALALETGTPVIHVPVGPAAEGVGTGTPVALRQGPTDGDPSRRALTDDAAYARLIGEIIARI